MFFFFCGRDFECRITVNEKKKKKFMYGDKCLGPLWSTLPPESPFENLFINVHFPMVELIWKIVPGQSQHLFPSKPGYAQTLAPHPGQS